MKNTVFAITLVTLFLLVLGGAKVAAAQTGFAKYGYTDATHWWTLVTDMPDFDQVRATTSSVDGLRGDGKMFCGPTAAANVMVYLANNGHSNVGIGAGDWEPTGGSDDAQKYDEITDFLEDLGDEMDTDLAGDNTTGTTGDNFVDVLQDYLADDFDVTAYSRATSDHATIGRVMRQGGLVVLVRGTYKWDTSLQAYTRTGGHFLTVVAAGQGGSHRWLSVRDSGRTNDATDVQSNFKTGYYTLSSNPLTSDEGYSVKWQMETSDIDLSCGSSHYLDSIIEIMPKERLSPVRLRGPIENPEFGAKTANDNIQVHDID